MIPRNSLEEWLQHYNHRFHPFDYYPPRVPQSYKMPNEHKHKNLLMWMSKVASVTQKWWHWWLYLPVTWEQVRTPGENKEQNNYLAVDIYVLWLNQGISSYLPMRNLWLGCSWSVLEINNSALLCFCVQLLPPAAYSWEFLALLLQFSFLFLSLKCLEQVGKVQ